MTKKISSKINLIPFLLILIMGIGLFGGIAIMLLLRFFKVLNESGTYTWGNIIFPFFAVVFIFFTVIYLLNNFAKITIDKKGINFNSYIKSVFYNWDEIEKIKMTGKENHSFLFVTTPMEATTFTLKNGIKKNIWVENYSNASELRVILERANKLILENNSKMDSLTFEINKKSNNISSVDLKNKIEYNGNYFLSFNGIMLFGFMIFILYLIFGKYPEIKLDKIPGLSIVALVLFGIFSYPMHYFLISDKYVIVRHNIWFWVKKIYLIENIKEVVIETPHKQSTSLRIITKDYSSKIYQAGSLRDKTWKKLKGDFIKRNISVRNETFF